MQHIDRAALQRRGCLVRRIDLRTAELIYPHQAFAARVQRFDERVDEALGQIVILGKRRLRLQHNLLGRCNTAEREQGGGYGVPCS